MGVALPETIRVLSPEFKEFVKELVFEVNRVSEAYMDLQRVRANEVDFDTFGRSAKVSFFQCGSGGGEITPTSLAPDLVVQTYSGTVFDVIWDTDLKEFRRSNVVSGVNGHDFGIVENRPDEFPDPCVFTAIDQLDPGTIAMCERVTESDVFFSSVKPRLSCRCEK